MLSSSKHAPSSCKIIAEFLSPSQSGRQGRQLLTRQLWRLCELFLLCICQNPAIHRACVPLEAFSALPLSSLPALPFAGLASPLWHGGIGIVAARLAVVEFALLTEILLRLEIAARSRAAGAFAAGDTPHPFLPVPNCLMRASKALPALLAVLSKRVSVSRISIEPTSALGHIPPALQSKRQKPNVVRRVACDQH